MTIDEAKKILLSAKLSPLEQNALHVFLQEIDYKDLPGEEWRDVVDYEGLYQVSNYARVKSLIKKKKQKFLKQILVSEDTCALSFAKTERKKSFCSCFRCQSVYSKSRKQETGQPPRWQ